MKKYILLVLLLHSVFAFAENNINVPALLKDATQNFSIEDMNGYPQDFIRNMSDSEKKEFNQLKDVYDTTPTQEQKIWKELIQKVYEKCPDNANSLPTNTSILNPNVVFSTPDRIIIQFFEEHKSPYITEEWYKKASARKKLSEFIATNQNEIYAYATLFCPRQGMQIRLNADMDSNFSYRDFYDKLSTEEQNELNRLVFISKKHLKRLQELGLITEYMFFTLQDVPQLMYKDFIQNNPQTAQIFEYCQDECHVHELFEQRKAQGVQESESETWKNYALEYAKTQMKTPESKCDDPNCFCHTKNGAFFGHKQSFTEVANDIENLKGKTVVFSPNGQRDEIDITDGIAYSLSNGRIVVFPKAQDDTQLLTAAVFFSEETAKNLAKECTLNQRYGYENSKRMFCAGENCGEKKCYPRENSEND